jgi:hypothetical protein
VGKDSKENRKIIFETTDSVRKAGQKKIGTAWSKFKIDLSPSCDKVTCLILALYLNNSLHTLSKFFYDRIRSYSMQYTVLHLKKPASNFVRSY